MTNIKFSKGFSTPLTIGVIVAILVLAAGLYYALRQDQGLSPDKTGKKVETKTDSTATEGSNTTIDNGTTTEAPSIKTFSVEARNFSFSVKEMRVKKGDTVKIELTSADGFHDITLDEFNAHTSRVSTGQSATVEFVASKTGTFEYYCSVGTHRSMGMTGKLIVE